ncbi:cadmium resistance transporter [Actinophytocola sp. NPDC049390]|uniref:cadmium resistance transporter n=1 Tax=Actinophytocola sp. NPDC049390 TaxID=3363894 RepID=UPI0037AA0FC1
MWVVVGQYLGFAALLAVSMVGALGAGLLPAALIPYLGVLPLVLGVRAAWRAWRERRDTLDDEAVAATGNGPAVFTVAAVTLANGGDNIGVYVPVFTTAGTGGLIGVGLLILIEGNAFGL